MGLFSDVINKVKETASLSKANLSEANLSEANLSEANLSNTYYWATNFKYVKSDKKTRKQIIKMIEFKD